MVYAVHCVNLSGWFAPIVESFAQKEARDLSGSGLLGMF
jgi:hypothetical protein